MRKNRMARGIALAVLASAIVALSFIALGVRPDGVADYYRDTLNPAGFAVWLSGFVIATLAPPVAAIACWIGSSRFRHGWLLHFLLLPTTYAVVRGSVKMMLLAANEPDSDGPTGWATDPAALLLLICPVIYFSALGVAHLRRRRVLLNGS